MLLEGNLTSTEELQACIDEYCVEHLYTYELQQQMVNHTLSACLVQWLGAQSGEENVLPNPADFNVGSSPEETSQQSFNEEFRESLHGVQLEGDQLRVYENIMERLYGVHVVSGVPGAGKTLLAKKLCADFEAQGKTCWYVQALEQQHLG